MSTVSRLLFFLFNILCLLKDSSKPITRESWMTELPPEMKDFGLGPRTFKRRADGKSGDRSVWTDTPADRERKAKVRGLVCSCISVHVGSILKKIESRIIPGYNFLAYDSKGKRFPLKESYKKRKRHQLLPVYSLILILFPNKFVSLNLKRTWRHKFINLIL